MRSSLETLAFSASPITARVLLRKQRWRIIRMVAQRLGSNQPAL
jgi:hypothetical protein